METFLLADIILAAIAVAWLFAAAMQDLKKREVANWLSFSLIIIALAIRAIASIVSWQAYYLLYGIIATALFFGVANLFYYTRIFAGGDAKLLIALAAAFATTPSFISGRSIILLGNISLPFMAVFLLNMLFVGSVYGIVWSFAIAFSNFREFTREFGNISRKIKVAKVLFFVLFLVFAAVGFRIRENILVIVSAMFLVFPYLLIFVKSVENSCMVKNVKTSELTEGDWLFKPVKAGKKMIMPAWEGLSAKDIEFIKKARIKNARIKQGIPFVPVFLIALLISFFANLLVFFISLLS